MHQLTIHSSFMGVKVNNCFIRGKKERNDFRIKNKKISQRLVGLDYAPTVLIIDIYLTHFDVLASRNARRFIKYCSLKCMTSS